MLLRLTQRVGILGSMRDAGASRGVPPQPDWTFVGWLFCFIVFGTSGVSNIAEHQCRSTLEVMNGLLRIAPPGRLVPESEWMISGPAWHKCTYN